MYFILCSYPYSFLMCPSLTLGWLLRNDTRETLPQLIWRWPGLCCCRSSSLSGWELLQLHPSAVERAHKLFICYVQLLSRLDWVYEGNTEIELGKGGSTVVCVHFWHRIWHWHSAPGDRRTPCVNNFLVATGLDLGLGAFGVYFGL